jgi:thermitase
MPGRKATHIVKSLQFIILSLLLLSPSLLSVARAEFNAKNWGLQSANVQKAWTLTQGSKNVVVAVIDTGIDATHPDLKANLWKSPLNASGKPGNGSIYGWDFVTKSSNPPDYHGHGTHIAGIIGAIVNSKNGISGVSPNVQIMAVRYYDETAPGKVNLANTIKALHYAINNGARIINYSGGGPEFSQEEYEAMREAEQKNILIVAAAGNDHHNTDTEANYYYPAAYQLKGLKNIISVASIDEQNRLLSSSNWGANSVDVAAPGEGILSTIPNGRYGKMTGTSQATAFVSGIAALILAKQPSLKAEQVKKIIMDSVELETGLRGKVMANGKVDAYKALLAVSPALPSSYKLPVRQMASQSK